MTTPTLAHHLEPGTGRTRTPAEALRAVGLYLDRERPVSAEQPKWPGPWKRAKSVYYDDVFYWNRYWADGRNAVADYDGVGRVDVGDGAHCGPEVGNLSDPANRRAADAILATRCPGQDPHKGSGQYDEQPTPPADPDPTTIDVSGTGLPAITVDELGDWWWTSSRREDVAVIFWPHGWGALAHESFQGIASGPETGPEARRLACAALQQYVASKRSNDAQ